MKRYLAIGTVAFALAACSPQQQKQAADLIAGAQQACASIGPIVRVAGGFISDPEVKSIIGYANSVCAPLAAGAPPASIDANTPAWLGDLGGMLKVLIGR